MGGCASVRGTLAMASTVRFGTLSKVVTLVAALLLAMGLLGAGRAVAWASTSGHLDQRGSHGAPGSGLSLAEAPSALRMAVRRALGVPTSSAGSAFQRAELTAADGTAGDLFG